MCLLYRYAVRVLEHLFSCVYRNKIRMTVVIQVVITVILVVFLYSGMQPAIHTVCLLVLKIPSRNAKIH